MKRNRIVLQSLVVIGLLLESMTAGAHDIAPGRHEMAGHRVERLNPNSSGLIQFLTGPNQKAAREIVLDYLDQEHARLGLKRSDLIDMIMTDQYTSAHNGVTHIYLRQRLRGIEVTGGNINVNVASDGSIINLGNSFVTNLAAVVNTHAPQQTPEQAVRAAANHLGLQITQPLRVEQAPRGAASELVLSRGGISVEPIAARLVYQPVADNAVRLAWNIEIAEHGGEHWWSMNVDAVTGAVLAQFDYVDNDTWVQSSSDQARADAQRRQRSLMSRSMGMSLLEEDCVPEDSAYRVFAQPVESPNFGSRTLVCDPADSDASPFGWHDIDGILGPEFTRTRGNNVHAYTDIDHNGLPDPGGDPDGGLDLLFDFPFDPSQQPFEYRPAAVTNLFYWNNIVHDVFYHYGFDESAGNFQVNNYGRGGMGDDDVRAEAQDGSGVNNANFFTLADGHRPRMQMFVFTAATFTDTTNIDRDSDLDSGVITHEYGHGISNRLTGGPHNAACLVNQEQMGEGWSDFFSLALTAEEGDSGTDVRGAGTYVLFQPTDGRGVRPTPYSTDMMVNPSSYDTIKDRDISVPHGVGYVWATMLWEVYWNLVSCHGFNDDLYDHWSSGGNNLAIQLVMDGMKLQPCMPGFVEARDAILQADMALTGGENQCRIWRGFAKRGLGFHASQGLSTVRDDKDQVENFDLPDFCPPEEDFIGCPSPDTTP